MVGLIIKSCRHCAYVNNACRAAAGWMEALKSRPELLGVAAEEVVGLGMCSSRGRRLCRRTRPSSRAVGVFFVKSCRACKQAKERENAWVWWDGCRVSKVIPAYLIKCLTWQPAIGGANPSHLPLPT